MTVVLIKLLSTAGRRAAVVARDGYPGVKNPDIKSSILSREVLKAVVERASPEIQRHSRIQAAGALVSVARGGEDTGEDGGGGRKWSRRYSEGAAPVVSPHQDASYFVQQQQQQQQFPSSDFDQIRDDLFLKEDRSSGSVNRRIRGTVQTQKGSTDDNNGGKFYIFFGKIDFLLIFIARPSLLCHRIAV